MIPRLAIFDCDGVLVDSEGPTNTLMAEDLRAHGLALSLEEIPPLFVGGTMEDVFHEARRLGADLPDDWVDLFYTKMFACLDKGVPVIPGVIDLIDALEAKGAQVWVASNGPMGKMQRTLGPSGLWDRFAGRIMSREQFAPKPEPAMILHAMAQYGANADETVFIDDSPTGCRAGVNAGVRTIGFAAETDPARLDPLGIEIVSGMDELRGILLG